MLRPAAPLALALLAAACAPSGPLPFDWPPEVGARFPDLELRDFRGDVVKLSEVGAGKVLLIEPVGMT